MVDDEKKRRIAEYNRRWQKENADKIRASHKKYYESIKERKKEERRIARLERMEKETPKINVIKLSEVLDEVAAGRMTKEEAAKELGYAKYEAVSKLRCKLGLRTLRQRGWVPPWCNRSTDDEIEDAFKRIALGANREDVAKELGFSSYEQMNRRRGIRGIPPLRDIWKELKDDGIVVHKSVLRCSSRSRESKRGDGSL